jgi:peptidoglycan/LPS O-acetylase OafA/YrhL
MEVGEVRTSAARAALQRAADAHPLTTGGSARRRANNFDALRLLAALAVLVSHGFALAGEPQPKVGSQDLGTIGVYVFFGISGFLIAQSWTIEPSFWRYLAKRALRIMPALVVVLLFTVLMLGPIFTTVTAGEYFSRADTWTYLLRNSVLTTAGELPGVFVDNTYPRQVNGSLWTLAPESWAYLGVAFLGVTGVLRRSWVAPAVAALLLAVPHDPTGLIPWPKEIWLLQAFAIGTCLYLLRERIPWHGGVALILLAAFAIAPSEGLQLKLVVVAVPYAAVYLAYRGPAALRRLTTRGDFSYGIYLYAWPVGQAVAAAWTGIGATALIALSLPLTYLLAVGSWHYVERPALSLKNSLRVRTADPRAPTADGRAGDTPLDSPPHAPTTRGEAYATAATDDARPAG